MDIVEIQNEIVAEFSVLDDWFDVYEHLIELGRGLDALSPEHRTEDNAIPGCQSNVWLRMGMENGTLKLEADSDALITRGILSLLLRVMDGTRPEEIMDSELFFLDETGLSTNLSPSRSDGVKNIINTIMGFVRNHK